MVDISPMNQSKILEVFSQKIALELIISCNLIGLKETKVL